MQLNTRLPVSTGELVCACGLLVLGVFVLGYGYRYPLVSDGVVGPGLMPLICGAGLTIVSAILVLKALQRSPAEPEDVPAQPAGDSGGTTLSIADFAEDEADAAGKPATVAGILILLVMAVLLAPMFGLIEMLGLLVFVCLLVFEREGFVTAALMAIGSMVAGWVLFGLLFEVPLPYGSVWHALGWW